MKATGERLIPGSKSFSELEHLNRYYFVVNQLELKDKFVLDIASGEGYGSDILAVYAKSVVGVDVSNEAVEHAKAKYKKNNLKYLQGDAIKIPLEDNSIDVVISFETIEHHDKHDEMLQEIKRVLKSEGILIISSPDKHYYSDVPNYKNQFHVKELYYNEFKTLISSFFTKAFFFNQRTFGGSIIALDETYKRYNQPLVVEQAGEKHLFLPEYNIAIATDDLQFEISNQIILYTEQEKVITLLDVENAVYSKEYEIKNKIIWKIGYFFVSPFKLIRHLIRNF